MVKSGKWGNVSRIQNGKMRLVQESAHTGISADSNLFAPEGDTGLAGVEPVEFDQPLLEAFMARFEEAWKNQDAAALAGEFTEDAIRVVSSQPVTLRGRAAIEKSFEDNFSAESRFGATTIDTFVLGYQSIDAEHFIANGIWKIKDPSGAVIRSGKWAQLPGMLETHRRNGCITLDQHLKQLVEAGQIERDVALRHANSSALPAMLGGDS